MTRRLLLLASVLPLATGSVAAQGHGFTLRPGWPVTYDGSSADGGMLVNMDADPELELLQVVGTGVHALNLDATPVPGWPVTVDNGTRARQALVLGLTTSRSPELGGSTQRPLT